MKIKHFAGYGSVEVTKVSKKVKDGITTMVIKVKGNHERGINLGTERYYFYDIHKWLLSKFDRSVKDNYDAILSVDTIESWEVEKMKSPLGNKVPTDIEVCTYTITYKN